MQTQIFSLLASNEELAINTYPTLTSNRTVALGFNTNESGLFSITAGDLSSFDSNISIYLEDLHNNVLTNLRLHNTYAFNSDMAKTNERFVLHFNTSATDINAGNATPNNINIYMYDHSIYISNIEDDKSTLNIYNLLGQEVVTPQQLRNGLNKVSTNLATGQYIVKVLSQSKMKSQILFVD